ncbi:MAG: hypothetical protein BGO99_14460 [Nitrosospira sp. 56-18]|nr:MAG: hypothetical protein BGO99_14460 [Nitrosospira sp. 56-18]
MPATKTKKHHPVQNAVPAAGIWFGIVKPDFRRNTVSEPITPHPGSRHAHGILPEMGGFSTSR